MSLTVAEKQVQPSRSATARPLAVAALLGSGLLLAACAGAPRVVGIYEPENAVSQRLGAVPVPSYGKGDRFSFAGGRVEKVIAVNGDAVRWQHEGGLKLLRPRDFARPAQVWESVERRGEQHTHNGPGELWPLAIGKVETFQVRRSVTDKAGGQASQSVRNFDCTVETAETVTVPAGTFDTFRVACRRYNSSSKRLVETRIWNYAPKVGHYVRRDTVKHKSGEREVIELQSYRRAGA